MLWFRYAQTVMIRYGQRRVCRVVPRVALLGDGSTLWTWALADGPWVTVSMLYKVVLMSPWDCCHERVKPDPPDSLCCSSCLLTLMILPLSPTLRSLPELNWHRHQAPESPKSEPNKSLFFMGGLYRIFNYSEEKLTNIPRNELNSLFKNIQNTSGHLM